LRGAGRHARILEGEGKGREEKGRRMRERMYRVYDTSWWRHSYTIHRKGVAWTQTADIDAK